MSSAVDEIIDALEDRGLLPSEVVEKVYNTLKDKYNSEKILKEYAISNNICPRCGYELKLHTWKESRGAHFGCSSEEEVSELRCVDCEWTDEDDLDC